MVSPDRILLPGAALKTAAAAALVALVAACAAFGISEAECRGTDWHQRGERDGFGGHPPQDLRLIRECARYGVQVSQAQYLEGWTAGHDEWDRLMGSIDMD